MEESKSKSPVNKASAVLMLTAEEQELFNMIATVIVETSLREVQENESHGTALTITDQP